MGDENSRRWKNHEWQKGMREMKKGEKRPRNGWDSNQNEVSKWEKRPRGRRVRKRQKNFQWGFWPSEYRDENVNCGTR
jgi:hypothetical protein